MISTVRQLPQLCMERKDLENLEEIRLPEGYSLRSFESGDESSWETIIAESFGREDNPDKFSQLMDKDPAFKPERVLFIIYNGEPVATASAWYKEKFGIDTGNIHMVGVRPGHQGKGLGYLINLAALHRFALEGRNWAILETDDFRLAAIKTYIRLGFTPLLVHENQGKRWDKIYSILGLNLKGEQ